MAKFEQIIPMTGVMVDSIDRASVASDKGIVLNRMNMRPDLTGSQRANVPIAGTILREVELPEGTNKTLGWCKDNENEAIIWFVWNSNSDHCIFRYFSLTKTTQKIFFKESSLGLSDNTEIAAEVVAGRLYWNDNTDHPKAFNISKAVNYTAGLSSEAYTDDDKPFDTNVLPLIKTPPRYAPTVSYETTTEVDGVQIDFNNLRKKQWQVKYCYVYEDYQESAYSPISKVALSDGEVSATGQWIEDLTFNNTLKIIVNSGVFNVKQIKVAIRDASNQNGGAFYLFKTIDKFKDDEEVIPSDSIYDVRFLNNSMLESIDTTRENAYYHDIPLVARDMFLLDAKYLAMSMPKTGYDFKNEDIDYSIGYDEADTDFDISSIPMSSDYERLKFNKWSNKCGRSGIGSTRIRITVPEKFYPNSVYRVVFKTPDFTEALDELGLVKQPDVTASWSSPAERPDNYPEVAQEALISELSSAIDTCYSIPINIRQDGENMVRFDFYNSWGGLNAEFGDPILYWMALWNKVLDNYQEYIYGSITDVLSAPVYRGLKRGQYHPFGIVYNDSQGRYNAVFGDNVLYVPSIDETTDPDSSSKVYTPKITINNTPPVWAETYRIAYIPYNSYTYTQMVPGVVLILGGDDENGIESGYSFLKINQAILAMLEEFPDSLISAYTWMKGDRLRQVGSPDSYEILREFTRTYNDNEETVTETGYLLKADFTVEALSDQIPLIEIYRPNLTPQDKVYYEIGEDYAILLPGTDARMHSGNIQNQTASQSAVISMNFGDIYYRARFSSEADAGYALVEDNNFSDYYESSGINLGRGVVKTDLKQTTTKRVVKTENYIEDTELNRLNILLPGDEYYPTSEVYGDITKTLERGDTIKIIQSHRETSVYVGKTYAKDAGGGDIALSTTNIFGSPHPYANFAGSKYRRSVIAAGNNVYYFDLTTSDFYRSATNGTMSISKKYGMNKFFERKSEAFRNYTGEKDIIVGFEPSNNVIYISFIMGLSIETIAFSEEDESKGFVFHVEFSNNSKIPEEYANYGDYLYSFVDGQLYEHGNGPANQFYGSGKKTSMIEVVANQYPQLRKTFEFMSVHSNGEWTAEMEIEADDNYSFGQKTTILPKMFKSREGVKTSAVPRNITTPIGGKNFQLLYSGNKMSGNSMKISFRSVNFTVCREVKITSINQE